MNTSKFSHISDLSDPEWRGEALVHSLADSSELFIFAYSPKKNSLVSWSNNAAKILGTSDSAISRDANVFLRHVHDGDRFRVLRHLETALRGREHYQIVYRWKRPDNREERLLHCRGKLTQIENEFIFEGILFDITEPLSCLSTASMQLQNLGIAVIELDLEFITTAIWGDRNLVTTICSQEPDTQTPLQEGKDFPLCISNKKLQKQIQDSLEKGLLNAGTGETLRWSKDNRTLEISIISTHEKETPTGIHVVLQEITQRLPLEEEYKELKQLSHFHQIKNGITHNLKNLLQTVLGETILLANHSGERLLVQQSAARIRELINRSAGLIDQIPGDPEYLENSMESADLNTTLLKVLQNTEKKDWIGSIQVELGSPPPVSVSQQILLKSLSDIFAQFPGKNIIKEECILRTLREKQDKDIFATLEIEFTGVKSLSKTEQWKKFVYEYFQDQLWVEKNISIRNRPQESLQIKFPSLKNSFETPIEKNSRAPCILVVDDDHLILSTMKIILDGHGYPVVVADQATTALDLAKQHQQSLKLVLIDAIMPGVGGSRILQKLKKEHPNLQFLGFSGASQNHTRSLRDAGAIDILRKPVDPELLRVRVEELLGAPKQSSGKIIPLY